MTDIIVTLTDAQYKAMQRITTDVEDWVINAAVTRAAISINEIVKLYTNQALDEGVTIPSTRDAIVIDAFARGWVSILTEPVDNLYGE